MEETPVEVTAKYLEGLVWPVDKAEVVEAAQRNGAPEDVVQMIRDMDKDRLTGPNEVHNALWHQA